MEETEYYYKHGERYAFPKKLYVSRTEAYYDEDIDDYVFMPDLWTWSEREDDINFVGKVYELNAEASKELTWWNECRNDNAYQRSRTFNGDYRSPEEFFRYITQPENAKIIEK